jgi:hypothetical protein
LIEICPDDAHGIGIKPGFSIAMSFNSNTTLTRPKLFAYRTNPNKTRDVAYLRDNIEITRGNRQTSTQGDCPSTDTVNPAPTPMKLVDGENGGRIGRKPILMLVR